MGWVHFFIGMVIDGGIGLFVAAIMFAASQADDKLLGDDQYK